MQSPSPSPHAQHARTADQASPGQTRPRWVIKVEGAEIPSDLFASGTALRAAMESGEIQIGPTSP